MESAPCPECHYEIALPQSREGQRLPCPNCGTELEILSVEPLELDWAYTDPDEDLGLADADDDWDDDWDDQDLDDIEDEDDGWDEP